MNGRIGRHVEGLLLLDRAPGTPPRWWALREESGDVELVEDLALPCPEPEPQQGRLW